MENQEKKSPQLIVLSALIIGVVLSLSVVGYLIFWDSSLKQVNRGGAVKIVAEYLPPKENIVNPISFSLLIETHSDEFEVFDVQKISFLRVNDGPLRAAAKWTPSGKGHHLDGTITFAQALPQGTHNLKLIIRNIDGVDERTLEWDITKKG